MFSVLNSPYSKPIELVRKDEINIEFYHEWFKNIVLRKFLGCYSLNDFNKITGKTGLDEFFWN